ncbi:hypothetical protein MRB53_035448 [Persea americana]|uniref:Uncharacterized protein n=1 Tax=Persea americana TaxID=3435 RepID=A0ACC2K4M8_PERAE|nr:hypothetical protein MRB53_035448 [Persea americana]
MFPGVSDSGISVMATELQKLRSINIYGNDFISDVSLIELSSRCPSLSEIPAWSCSRLTISGINYVIQHCDNLCSLSISINSISSSHAFIESSRSNARNLQCLNLSGNGMCVSDELLYVIGEHNLVLPKACILS